MLQAPERRGLGILNFADSEVIVPIPVFTDLKVADESSALTDITDATSEPRVPSIAITKPPAPLPVGLPTFNDVVSLPSPPDSQRSSTDDLEAGLGLGMTETPTEVVIGKVPPRHLPTAKKVEIPVERIISADDVRIETPPPIVENVADLLADTAPAMEVVPLQPSTPTIDVVELDTPGSSEPIVTPRLSQEEVEEPSTTIRLVGGGGSSGIIDVSSADDDAPDPAADVASETSSGSRSPPSKKDKNHEKSKSSLTSLKKIANIGGGKRKKDPSSRIEEMI